MKQILPFFISSPTAAVSAAASSILLLPNNKVEEKGVDVEKERLVDCFRPNGKVKKQQQQRNGEEKKKPRKFYFIEYRETSQL
jgi:hypothetical protein